MDKNQFTATKNQPENNSKDLFKPLTDITIEKISGGDKDHKGWCDLASFSQANFIPEVREVSW